MSLDLYFFKLREDVLPEEAAVRLSGQYERVNSTEEGSEDVDYEETLMELADPIWGIDDMIETLLGAYLKCFNAGRSESEMLTVDEAYQHLADAALTDGIFNFSWSAGFGPNRDQQVRAFVAEAWIQGYHVFSPNTGNLYSAGMSLPRIL